MVQEEGAEECKSKTTGGPTEEDVYNIGCLVERKYRGVLRFVRIQGLRNDQYSQKQEATLNGKLQKAQLPAKL